MKTPAQRHADGLVRAMRRDTMIGTAVLVMLETGLVGVAAAMTGLNSEEDQPEPALGGDQEAQKTRPAGGSKSLPDTRLATAGKPEHLAVEPTDDSYTPSADFSRLGSSGLHRPREIGNGGLSLEDTDGIPAGHVPAGTVHGAVRSPPFGGLRETGGSASEEKDHPAPPPADNDMKVLLGTEARDVIAGTDGDDYVFGRGGPDVLAGGTGNDRLLGGEGDDILSGGEGSDILVGDKGRDELTGGAGADRFLFRAGFGRDTVTDFKANGALDVIDVAKNEFTDFAALAHHLSDTDLGAVLTLHDGSTLTLSHVTVANLTMNDFRFEV
ncbi:calcium-binding protein [Rhizobium terrae]|uniref:calcium-binding protein n=1 Tax=Rhizobium terrae TaxID=2171756 RepID=UPI000E3E8B4C|nr:calcium-binding protein [Rhizobium terrae]